MLEPSEDPSEAVAFWGKTRVRLISLYTCLYFLFQNGLRSNNLFSLLCAFSIL